jgi:hypothetical protein
VLPEQGRSPEPPLSGIAESRRHGAAASARAWHLGCWILATGGGSCPAPAATAGGAHAASRPVVAAAARGLPAAAGGRW